MNLSRNANRLVWAVMLAAIVWLSYEFRDTLAFLTTGTLTASEEGEDQDTVRLRWVGPVEAPMSARFREEISAWAGRKRRFVLEISSPGGSLDQGAAVIRQLRDLRRTHEVETVVLAGERCLSMCVPIYLQGTTRVASPRSRWMFHEVRFREQFSDKDAPVPEQAKIRATDKLFADYFKPAGVSDTWITVTRNAMRRGDVWRTGQALVDEQAGVIQKLQ
ncbi:MAG: ATP-dependent Clp protease proteolytic subunit [Hyphomicrobiaceae bacterium]